VYWSDPKDLEVVMFDNSPSAPDSALSERSPVTRAETQQFPVRRQRTSAHRNISAAGAARGAARTPEAADVEITAISSTEWRIADHAIQNDDPNALLGFIQAVGTAFEVTNLDRPRERAYFTSFDRATASLRPRGVLA
jgi:hypothetical protein